MQKFGISFASGKLLYHPRGAPLGLGMLKSLHILEPQTSNPMAINIVGTQWAAKPRTKAALPQLPEGFLQPTKTSTPFHYAFATGSRRVAFACVMFCVSRAFAGALQRSGLPRTPWAMASSCMRKPLAVYVHIQQ